MSPLGWIVRASLLFAGLIFASSAHASDSKVDLDLDNPTELHPVFVRLADQLIIGAGDHERFCLDHANAKRRDLRTEVVKTLHQKADRSWAQVAAKVAALTQAGQIQAVERYWIVNGFACRATGTACRELGALGDVGFVYRERGPLHQQQQIRPPLDPAIAARQLAILRSVADGWRDDSDDPLTTKGLDVSWNLKAIGAEAAWTEEKATGKGVIVALMDSGMMIAPALTKALWKNPKETLNGQDDDGNGYVDDLFGYNFGAGNNFCIGDETDHPHGSMCAGVLVGRPDNARNLMTGVAPRARLMVLRGMGYLKAYEYALANGADVISMSYMWVDMELGNYRGVYRTAHEHLSAAGIVAVGGAGNYSKSPVGHQIALPKDIPCVIATAGLNRDGSKAAASSEGPCTWNGVKFYDDYPPARPLIKPDVTAFFTGFAVWNRPDNLRQGWTVYSKEGPQMALVVGPGGNSFSGPHAAGVAALMLSANPDLPAWEVKKRLEQTCRDLGPTGRDITTGAGLLRAREAVRAALKTTPGKS